MVYAVTRSLICDGESQSKRRAELSAMLTRMLLNVVVGEPYSVTCLAALDFSIHSGTSMESLLRGLRGVESESQCRVDACRRHR